MTTIRRMLACGAVAASLGFGAAQALAAPSARVVAGERQCNQGQCSRMCKAAGYDGGACAGGECACFIAIP
jgi:hypothetical protein